MICLLTVFCVCIAAALIGTGFVAFIKHRAFPMTGKLLGNSIAVLGTVVALSMVAFGVWYGTNSTAHAPGHPAVLVIQKVPVR